MPAFRTLDDVSLSGKRVLCRVDLNVPVSNGVVTDATRIERVVPTLREIMNKGGALIVLAHFDRPKGKVVPEMSLKPVAAALSKELGRPVQFLFTDWREAPALDVKPGECVLMENTRYHPGEEKNDESFSRMLASLGDIYVNDAFSAAHRAHSSTEGVAHLLPAYAGRAMEAELKALQGALETPKRPVIAIVGGAKVSTKIDLLGNLATKVDALVIGGAMANTFLLAQGHAVGKSLAEKDLVDTARKILQQADDEKCGISGIFLLGVVGEGHNHKQRQEQDTHDLVHQENDEDIGVRGGSHSREPPRELKGQVFHTVNPANAQGANHEQQ